jgi:multisubunit Na+/H+ antiporter MnhG subunit
MSGLTTLAALVALSTGVGLVWVCIVGMTRARDAFDRPHFPGAAVLVGPPAVALALTFAEGWSPTSIRAWLIFAVLLLTNGILAHATSRAEWLQRRSETEQPNEARG